MIVAYEELLELVRSYPNSTKYEYVQDCQYTGLNGMKYSRDTASTGTASTSYVYAYRELRQADLTAERLRYEAMLQYAA